MKSHRLEGDSEAHLPSAVLVRTGCLGPCSVLLISKDGHPTACQDSLFQCLTTFTIIILPYTALEFLVLNLRPFSVYLWEVWLHLLYNLPINSLLRLNKPISFCLSLHIIISSPKNILVALHQTHFSMNVSCTYWQTEYQTQYPKFHKCRRMAALDLLAAFLLIKSKMLLLRLDSSIHCWFMLKLLSTKTLRSKTSSYWILSDFWAKLSGVSVLDISSIIAFLWDF